MKSCLLDRSTWDYCLDANGDWAVAEAPYARAQDVACAIKTFSGECWYDTTLGIPYFEEILGRNTPLQLIKEYFISAAKSVSGVVTAACYISSLTDRQLSGQVVTTDSDGNTSATGIGNG